MFKEIFEDLVSDINDNRQRAIDLGFDWPVNENMSLTTKDFQSVNDALEFHTNLFQFCWELEAI